MAVDAFMVIPSAPQPSPPNPPPFVADPVQDAYFSQAFSKAAAVVELRQFTLSTENPIVIGSTTGGAGAGKVRFNPLVVEKNVDRLSPSLFAISAQGLHFPTLQIFVRKAGGAAQPGKPYLAYEFSMVFVTQLQWSEDSGGDVPVEQVTFAYGALTLGYYPQKPDGSLAGNVTKLGWSQVANQATAGDALPGF